MILLTILIGLVFFTKHGIVYSLDCYNEKNEVVDFFYAQKFTETGPTKNGYSSFYPHESTFKERKLNGYDVTSRRSVISNIFGPIFQNPFGYNYIQYNDILPEYAEEIKLIPRPILDKKAISRGAFIWDNDKALLFQSNVPKFLPPFLLPGAHPFNVQNNLNSYSFPQEYLKDDQWFLCIVLDLEYVVTVLKHIILKNPRIYGHGFNNQFGSIYFNEAITVLNAHNNFITSEKGGKTVLLENNLITKTGKKFKIITQKFTKDKKKPLKMLKISKKLFPNFKKSKSKSDISIRTQLIFQPSMASIYI